MKFISRVIVCLLLIATMMLASCKSKSSDTENQIKPVKVGSIKFRNIPNEIQGFGTLSFLKKFDVSSAQEGYVKVIYFREGMEVKSGQILAALDNQQIDLAVGRAENALAQTNAALKLAEAALLETEMGAEAKLLNLEKMDAQMAQSWKAYYENERKFNSQNTLYLAGGVNEESMRVAKFTLESELEQIYLAEKELEIQRIGFREKDLIAAGITVPDDSEDKKNAFIELATARIRAELSGAREQCNAAEKELQSALLSQQELRIKSPARGIIVSRAFEEGEKIKREDKIFTIIESESLYATISVPESEAFFIDKGMKARVGIDGISKTYDGIVDLISPIADSQSFTFSVRILLPKEVLVNSAILENEFFAKPGMFARAAITLGEPRAVLTINESALFNKKNNEAYCFVVSGKMLAMRRLYLENSVEDEYIVTSGLSSGEIVALHPESDLKEGDYVSIIN